LVRRNAANAPAAGDWITHFQRPLRAHETHDSQNGRSDSTPAVAEAVNIT